MQEPVSLIRLDEVKRRTGYGKSAIYDMEQKGVFPKRVKLSHKSTAWVAAEIDQWCRARIADRDTGRQPKPRFGKDAARAAETRAG